MMKASEQNRIEYKKKKNKKNLKKKKKGKIKKRKMIKTLIE